MLCIIKMKPSMVKIYCQNFQVLTENIDVSELLTLKLFGGKNDFSLKGIEIVYIKM